MRLYLAGPVSNRPNYNRAAFTQAAEQLRSRGYGVILPIDFVPKHAKHDYAMQLCFRRISQGDIDGVALLDEWKTSRGSRLEARHAEDMGLEVWPVDKWLIERGWE